MVPIKRENSVTYTLPRGRNVLYLPHCSENRRLHGFKDGKERLDHWVNMHCASSFHTLFLISSPRNDLLLNARRAEAVPFFLAAFLSISYFPVVENALEELDLQTTVGPTCAVVGTRQRRDQLDRSLNGCDRFAKQSITVNQDLRRLLRIRAFRRLCVMAGNSFDHQENATRERGTPRLRCTNTSWSFSHGI